MVNFDPFELYMFGFTIQLDSFDVSFSFLTVRCHELFDVSVGR